MNKKIVIALGGNALGYTNEEEITNVKKVAKIIVDLKEEGYNIVVTHGNGPQVGKINKAMESIDDDIPFAECGAMSEGYIGYHLMQALNNELANRNINTECSTILTQVLVDKTDKAFKNPTKPIGKYYTKNEADKITKETGYIFKEDSGKGYRRVVPSPKPIEIIEKETIKQLLDAGEIVIACGGGGVPVIEKYNKLSGVDAVIDKDLSSSLLARQIDADEFIILTNVEKVSINYKQENEEQLSSLTISEAENFIGEKQFAEGSMLPKVKSCLEFVEHTKNKAIITSLDKAKEGVLGKTGTVICFKKEEVKKMAEKKTVEEKPVKKKTVRKKNFEFGLTAFSIILILIILLGVLTHFLPSAEFVGDTIVNGSGVVKATLADILMSPIKGFESAVDVCIFVFILGGFLKVVQETGALETGIKVLIKKLGGHELLLIPILMIIFSIGGTTYGMLEETVGFYALLAATMVAAGMDTIVASATVLLGAGVGVLGSTINPFATGVAISAAKDAGVAVNSGAVIAIGMILWLVSLAIAICFVMIYAAKVKRDKGSTFLSLREQKVQERKWGSKAQERRERAEARHHEKLKRHEDKTKVNKVTWLLVFGGITLVSLVMLFVNLSVGRFSTNWLLVLVIAGIITIVNFKNHLHGPNQEFKFGEDELTHKQKVTLILFGLAFVIMIFGFIPWGEFINTKWLSFSSFLTGAPLGEWWFFDSALWFLLIAIAIGIINGMKEKELVNNIVSGCADMMSVILIVAVARGASYLMGVTHLDNYIVYSAADFLRNMPEFVFTPLNYILHIILSIVVPSSSGLGTLSTPIMAPLAAELGYSVETTIMTFVAANGLVNLITPTCGAIMGGLALAGVEYTTWVKWSLKVVGCIALASLLILMLAMFMF